MGGPWSLLASVNRESAYHDGTLPFSHFHHVNDAQEQDKEDGVGSGQGTAGAWGGSWAGGSQGCQGCQEEGRTPGWNDMVRDERIQKEGQKAGGSGRGAEGRRREARPAWAGRLIILLAMPLSPPALPICLPFLAFWSVEAIPVPLPTPTWY